MKQNILPLLDALIRIPSVSSDIEKLHEIVDFVEAEFFDYPNAVIKRYEWNKKPSIVIQNFEGLEADIILNGHLDVVPPSEENQFEAVSRDGKIYARGAGDMKAGDAIMITLMKEIFSGAFTDKKVSLILTADEETGGEDGALEIVKLGYTASEGILVPDSGSTHEIVIAEKGIIDFDVEVQGRSGHSSRPWLSENAVESIIALYADLKSYIESPEDLSADNDYWSSTIQLTLINGGSATNVIPESATAHFNIRITEEFPDTKQFKKKIGEIILKHKGVIKNLQEGSLVYTDLQNSFVQNYLKTCENTLGKKLRVAKEHGATDGRYFAEKGIPLILHRPTCEKIHAKQENVGEEAIFQIYDCYRAFVIGKN